MSQPDQIFMATVQQSWTYPLPEAAEAFYNEIQSGSDQAALGATRTLIETVRPWLDVLEKQWNTNAVGRKLNDTAFDAVLTGFRSAIDTTLHDPVDRERAWGEVIAAASADELYRQATHSSVRALPTEMDTQALDRLMADPPTARACQQFLDDIQAQKSEDFVRAARMIRDHLPKNTDHPWHDHISMPGSPGYHILAGDGYLIPSAGHVFRTALEDRMSPEHIELCQNVIQGTWSSSVFNHSSQQKFDLPTPEEDASLREVGRAAEPVRALNDLLSKVDDPDKALRLACGVRDHWHVYTAPNEVMNKSNVATLEDALLRGWNATRADSPAESRNQLRDLLVETLIQPRQAQDMSTAPTLTSRRKPSMRR